MGAALIERRSLLMGALGALGLATARSSAAMGRVALGGRATLRIPHDTSRLDPHDLFDPMAALVGAAVFDTVYALDPTGNPYPALADGMPERDGRQTRVRLREGLRSARGHAVDARDLAATIERARKLAAVALLADVSTPSVDRTSPRVAVFRDVDPTTLVQVLASPVVALATRHSTPTAPDGTGSFRAEPSAARLLLVRNRAAARGASYLEEVLLDRAPDLAESLRAFEAQTADIGWLGAGYHQPRPGAVPFDLGAAAWVVLRTGNLVGEWGEPGVAQRLIDAIPPARLAHLALGRIQAPSGTPAWGAPPSELMVTTGSAHLIEVARTIASIVATAGHEVTVTPVAPADLSQARKTGAYALMIDVVRPIGPPGLATLVALATADQGGQARSIVRHSPRLSSYAPRALARTMKLAVVGELRVTGAAIASLRIAAARDGTGWDLGASYRVGTTH
jgi:peptide/nickel transport system substrate-binding protein